MENAAETTAPVEARSSKLRSKLSNGSKLLPMTDGRSATARRFKDLVEDIAADLGGKDHLSITCIAREDEVLIHPLAAFAGTIGISYWFNQVIARRPHDGTSLSTNLAFDQFGSHGESPLKAKGMIK
jgi:hypothetical protein